MPFQVKATVIGFYGDEELFPCHFGYRIGDEIIFDGEKIIGRVCPSVLDGLCVLLGDRRLRRGERSQVLSVIRFVGTSLKDYSEKTKKITSIYCGFIPTKDSNWQGKGGYGLKWVDGKPISLPVEGSLTYTCRDIRTGVIFKIEPFGLSKLGYDTPFYHREMSILEKIKAKPGIEVDKILDEFTDEEQVEYPPLSSGMVTEMLSELVFANLIEIREGKAYPI